MHIIESFTCKVLPQLIGSQCFLYGDMMLVAKCEAGPDRGETAQRGKQGGHAAAFHRPQYPGVIIDDTLWGVVRDELPFTNQRDSVAAARFIHICRGNEDNNPLFFQPPQHVPELFS